MTRDQMRALCQGNADAERFGWAWWNFCHTVDDLVDRDKAVSPAQRGFALVEFIQQLSDNPFFWAHRQRLTAAMVLAINAWVDSDSMDARLSVGVDTDQEQKMRHTRDVIKGWWHEVFYLMAYITGGWSGMQNASAARAYDFHPDTQEGT